MKLNNKGYSLPELLVASGLSIVLMGLAGYIFLQATATYTRTMRQYEAESEMLSAMYAVKNTLSRATSITYGGMAGGEANDFTARHADAPQAAEGRLFRYSSGTAKEPINLIAMTNIEMASDANESQLHGIGLFYQKSSPKKSGALYLDMERNPVQDSGDKSGGWVRVSPRNATSGFSRFVDFAVENIAVSGQKDADETSMGKPVLSAEFKMVVRYFTWGNPGEWRWCPAVLMKSEDACKGSAGHYDVEKRVKVVFTNNMLSSGQPPVRGLGKLYIFKTIGPQIR